MTKKVLSSTKMVKHVWAQQSQSEGYTSGRGISFKDTTLYSYATPIANFVMQNGTRACLITTVSYSVTTSGKHMPNSYDISNARIFRVKHIGISAGRAPYMAETWKLDNVIDMAHDYEALLEKLQRARSKAEYIVNELNHIRSTAQHYCEFFDLAFPAHKFPELSEELNQQIKENTKRRKEQELESEKANILLAEAASKRWMQHEKLEPQEIHAINTCGTIYMRIKMNKTEIETTRGAVFPVVDALEIFPHIKTIIAGKDSATKFPGSFFKLGNFTVDDIKPNGDVKAGCHYVKYAQIEAVAKQLNILA